MADAIKAKSSFNGSHPDEDERYSYYEVFDRYAPYSLLSVARSMSFPAVIKSTVAP